MISKINTPSFKAKFSNDAETVSILKDRYNNSQLETKIMIDLLKNSKTNDVVSLSHWDGKPYYTNGNNLLIECKNSKGEHVSGKATHMGHLFKTLLNLKLSDNTTIGKELSKITKRNPVEDKYYTEVTMNLAKQYEKDAGLDKYTQAIIDKNAEICDLEIEIENIKKKKERASQEFIEKYIDENV